MFHLTPRSWNSSKTQWWSLTLRPIGKHLISIASSMRCSLPTRRRPDGSRVAPSPSSSSKGSSTSEATLESYSVASPPSRGRACWKTSMEGSADIMPHLQPWSETHSSKVSTSQPRWPMLSRSYTPTKDASTMLDKLTCWLKQSRRSPSHGHSQSRGST